MPVTRQGENDAMTLEFIQAMIDRVDKYISRLPDNIHGNVMSTRPKTLDFAIELANDLMDQKLRTYAERQAENKRELDNNNRINNNFSRNKMSDFLVLKNQGTEARGMVYALGGGETNQELDNIKDDINT
nr:hypothetical protein [Tanacetum cinerariifolium]